MTAKEELSQYKYKLKKVYETLDEYQKYNDRATKITTILSNMPKDTSNRDKIGDNTAVMADLGQQYKQRWIEAEMERLKLEKKIDSVEEPYRTILHMRYIEDLPLFEIASKLKYKSYTYACEQHGIALKKYEKNRTKPKTSE